MNNLTKLREMMSSPTHNKSENLMFLLESLEEIMGAIPKPSPHLDFDSLTRDTLKKALEKGVVENKCNFLGNLEAIKDLQLEHTMDKTIGWSQDDHWFIQESLEYSKTAKYYLRKSEYYKTLLDYNFPPESS